MIAWLKKLCIVKFIFTQLRKIFSPGNMPRLDRFVCKMSYYVFCHFLSFNYFIFCLGKWHLHFIVFIRVPERSTHMNLGLSLNFFQQNTLFSVLFKICSFFFILWVSAHFFYFNYPENRTLDQRGGNFHVPKCGFDSRF